MVVHSVLSQTDVFDMLFCLLLRKDSLRIEHAYCTRVAMLSESAAFLEILHKRLLHLSLTFMQILR